MSVQVRLIHISFAFGKPTADLQAIRNLIDYHSVDWANYISNCYLVWTQIELASWTALLRTIPNMEAGYFFISAIDPYSPVEGWLPQWAWNWVQKYRTLYAPPPSEQPLLLPPNNL
jgi:hypothetical protein